MQLIGSSDKATCFSYTDIKRVEDDVPSIGECYVAAGRGVLEELRWKASDGGTGFIHLHGKKMQHPVRLKKVNIVDKVPCDAHRSNDETADEALSKDGSILLEPLNAYSIYANS